MEEELITAPTASISVKNHLYYKMQIKNLKLNNFRNRSSLEIDFDDHINIIIGPNAVGKTNILEAIYLLCTTKSFKAHYDRDMIKHGSKFARVDGIAVSDNEEIKLELVINLNSVRENVALKKVKVNKVSKTLQTFSGNLNGTLFTPEDIDNLTGSPSERRKYMDFILFQTDREYKN